MLTDGPHPKISVGAALASYKGGQRSAWPLWKRWDPHHTVRYRHLSVTGKLLLACVCCPLSIKVTVTSLAVGLLEFLFLPSGPVPYLSMHKGGLLLDPRVCLLEGILCPWPLSTNALCHSLPRVWWTMLWQNL